VVPGNTRANEAAAAGVVTAVSHQRGAPSRAWMTVAMAQASARTDLTASDEGDSRPSAFCHVIIAAWHSGSTPVPDVHITDGLADKMRWSSSAPA
jgi:hypothetical protein